MSKTADILKLYAEYAKHLGHAPTYNMLKDVGITKDTVRNRFGTLSSLEELAREEYPEAFFDNPISSVFTEEATQELHSQISKYKRFVVTTAVTGCTVNEKFLNCIRTYCSETNAKMLVLVSSDPAHDKNVKGGGRIDKRLVGETIVVSDVTLNDNLFLSTIKLSAKHIDPTTGLGRIGSRDGSFIFASPKQRLHMVPTSNRRLPHAIMTTGAVTDPDYSTTKYLSDRTATIAKYDHVLGAVIVEIKDNQIFHFRQVQYKSESSGFADLGVLYMEDGTAEYKPEAMVLGDWHSGDTDPLVKSTTAMMLADLKPNTVVVHDMFDGSSINHHEEHNITLRSVKADAGKLSLEGELKVYVENLEFLSRFSKEVVVVRSNHDEFLDRYLQQGKYVSDPANHRVALLLAMVLLDGGAPLEFIWKEASGAGNVRFLHRDDDYFVGGVQLAAHGDLGPNGSRGSLKNMASAYGDSVTGHSHTPGIYFGAYSVGTSTRLRLSYNKGPSSWLNTHCLVYPCGARQLINMIEGEYKC